MPEFLTVPQVAQLLKCDRSTIYELIRQGRIPHIKLGERAGIRIPKAEFEQWIADQLAASTPPAKTR